MVLDKINGWISPTSQKTGALLPENALRALEDDLR